MDRICDLPSFIVTGASASGKTTLVEQAIAGGYKYIPTHTTRPPRPGEVPDVHGVFLSKRQFEDKFRQGLYIEGLLGLEFAYMPEIGVYYGSPRKQVDLLKKNGFLFFSGVNPNCKNDIFYVWLRYEMASSGV